MWIIFETVLVVLAGAIRRLCWGKQKSNESEGATSPLMPFIRSSSEETRYQLALARELEEHVDRDSALIVRDYLVTQFWMEDGSPRGATGCMNEALKQRLQVENVRTVEKEECDRDEIATQTLDRLTLNSAPVVVSCWLSVTSGQATAQSVSLRIVDTERFGQMLQFCSGPPLSACCAAFRIEVRREVPRRPENPRMRDNLRMLAKRLIGNTKKIEVTISFDGREMLNALHPLDISSVTTIELHCVGVRCSIRSIGAPNGNEAHTGRDALFRMTMSGGPRERQPDGFAVGQRNVSLEYGRPDRSWALSNLLKL